MKKIIFLLQVIILSSFCFAANAQINPTELKQQISAGLDVNTRDDNGDTLLLWVLQNSRDVEPIRELISAGADVNAPSTSTGMTPLVYIATSVQRTKKEISERYAHLQSPQEQQVTAALIKKDIKESVEYARNIMEILIKSGADINQETPFGTPLMAASSADENIEIVDYLLSSGANVNQADHYGRTALFYAAHNNCQQITVRLLAAGADIDIKDINGKTYMNVTSDEWDM